MVQVGEDKWSMEGVLILVVLLQLLLFHTIDIGKNYITLERQGRLQSLTSSD